MISIKEKSLRIWAYFFLFKSRYQ